MSVTTVFRLLNGLVVSLVAAFPAAGQEWQATEKVAHYPVNGTTPMALYQSVGERGPKLSLGRVIAHTTFKLTWQRDYQQQGAACVLASAKPKLIVTYTLPKPTQKLPSDVAAKWAAFYEGIVAHEKLHGEFMRDLTQQIQDVSIGLRDENDPGCKKVRAGDGSPPLSNIRRVPARSQCPGRRRCTWWRAHSGRQFASVPELPYPQCARPTFQADGRVRWRLRCG